MRSEEKNYPFVLLRVQINTIILLFRGENLPLPPELFPSLLAAMEKNE